MFDSWFEALEGTAVATAIREGDGWFPWIESVHVLALVLVVGSIAVVDLRLLGWSSRGRSVAQTTAAALPITWCAFAVAVASGALLFSSNATRYAHNLFFEMKMLLIVAAGGNMLVFQLLLGRGAHAWRTPQDTPLRGRIAGALSLSLWIAVVACGRWIGFTLNALT
jgi:hypothetical protein